MQNKTLRRSNTEKMLAGVCGGLGRYFGIDPILFRILFILLALPGGVPGILLYAILWLAMPKG